MSTAGPPSASTAPPAPISTVPSSLSLPATAGSSKKRSKFVFNCEVVVNELSNLPYVSGFYYVKWRSLYLYLRSIIGLTFPSRTGYTLWQPPRAQQATAGPVGLLVEQQFMIIQVTERHVVWNEPLHASFSNITNDRDLSSAIPDLPHHGIDVSVGVDRDGILMPCELIMVVKQEANGGRDAETVGSVAMNMSEFAAQNQSATKRFLLSDSKLNATLKVSVLMKLTRGSTADFKVPKSVKNEIAALDAIRDLFSASGQNERTSDGQDADDSSAEALVNELASPMSSVRAAFGSLYHGSRIMVDDLSFYDDSEDKRVVEEAFFLAS
ncbi:hypothetical protein HDU84_003748 [Entophlyctis sp. JEL0112]|nr:hypothetical protein HDU84_003748 [Entophlyctis sp. JEL0112]